ncbi:cytochrome b561 [Aureimonas endophytica]|uniref:Cytochrome b561 n=1 Tax=Aureimonas endophytica TaxID=2027858 RepID=A0A916ZQF4_9HYPH|nr:cytochrome b [Aureimonas endophytica]GGE09025.1 cytochrome b561 [Aureimonas endophytica]
MRWRNDRAGYGGVAILLHWAIALVFLGEWPLGMLTQRSAEDPALQFELYQWHKSVGFLILALALPRLVWSLASRRPAPAGGLGPAEILASRAVHQALLALSVAVPLAGWAIASSSPLRIPSYVFDLVVVPPLPLGVSDAAEAFWSELHAILAYAAGALVLLHASAALAHQFVRRDAVLRRMLPRR